MRRGISSPWSVSSLEPGCRAHSQCLEEETSADLVVAVQEEYERIQDVKLTGFGRVMTRSDLKLYAICGSVLALSCSFRRVRTNIDTDTTVSASSSTPTISL